LLGFVSRKLENKAAEIEVPDGFFKQLPGLALVPSGIVFSFEQIGIAFRHKSLVSPEFFQDTACLNHFLKAAEQRFLRLSRMQNYISRHVKPSFPSAGAIELKVTWDIGRGRLKWNFPRGK
jgi:hypothetical protein